MNDVNIQDGRLETVKKLLQEDKRKLKLVLRRSSKTVERNVNVKISTDLNPMSGIRFAITASGAVTNSNDLNTIQDGDRIDMVIITHVNLYSDYFVYIRDFLVYSRLERERERERERDLQREHKQSNLSPKSF